MFFCHIARENNFSDILLASLDNGPFKIQIKVNSERKEFAHL